MKKLNGVLTAGMLIAAFCIPPSAFPQSGGGVSHGPWPAAGGAGGGGATYVAPTVTQTNWSDGFTYRNGSGGPIVVSIWVYHSVDPLIANFYTNGYVLWYGPSGNVSANIAPGTISSSQTQTNSTLVLATVPSGDLFVFTNQNNPVNAKNIAALIPNSGQLVTFAAGSATITNMVNQTNTAYATTAGTATNLANYAQVGLATNYTFAQFGVTNYWTWVTRCCITNGNNWLTSVNGNWTSADVGKGISIWYANTNARNLFTYITNVVSSTTIQVSNTAAATTTGLGGSLAGCTAVYGFDNQPALSNMLVTVTLNGGGRIIAPAGTFGMYPAIYNIGAYTNSHTAQLWIPGTATFSSGELVIDLEGNPAGELVQSQYLYDFLPPAGATIIFSGCAYATNDNSAWPYQIKPMGASVLDTRNAEHPTTALGNSYNGVNIMGSTNGVQFAMENTMLIMNNMGWVCGNDANLAVLNLTGLNEHSLNNVMVTTGCEPQGVPPMTGYNGYGIILPGNWANPLQNDTLIGVYGFFTGVDGGMGAGSEWLISACRYGIGDDFTGSQMLSVKDLWVIATPTILHAGSPPGYTDCGALYVTLYNVEVQDSPVTNWYGTNICLVSDAVGAFQGSITYALNNLLGASAVLMTNVLGAAGQLSIQSLPFGSVGPISQTAQTFSGTVVTSNNVTVTGADGTFALTPNNYPQATITGNVGDGSFLMVASPGLNIGRFYIAGSSSPGGVGAPYSITFESAALAYLPEFAAMTNGNFGVQSNLYLGGAIGMPSNTWTLAAATNGWPNWAGGLASSNGVPVWIYNSNGVAHVTYLLKADGIVP